MAKTAFDIHQEGDAYSAAGDYSKALASYRSAVAREPSAALYFNIGNVLRHQNRYPDALAAYDAALALNPSLAVAHHNRATCLLQLGDFAAGFPEYEWRKGCPTFREDPRYRLPRPWGGEDLQGKTLYIFAELYQGDLIQFGRYAREAEARGATVVLGAPVAMHALLQTMSPTIRLLPDDGPTPIYDYQCALMSLPGFFGATVQNVPREPYLQADPARVARWRDRIGEHGFKIGIAWEGSERAATRSFPLALAAERLARAPGVRLISLQKHRGLEQLEALPEGLVATLGDDFDPGPDAFVDTAAAMTCCDLFVTADTSVVHVAGALGVPTWLALPFAGDWRWLADRTDTPWYPSVRIFRQRKAGDWRGVFDDMARALTGQLA